MFCDQCGKPVGATAAACPHCGVLLGPAPVVPAQRPPERPAAALAPVRVSVPPVRAWLSFLSWTHLRGTVVALFAAWFGVPFVLLMAMVGVIVGGLAGTVQGTFAGDALLDRLDKVLTWAFPLPVDPAELLPTAAVQIGGIVGGLLGAVSGGWKLGWMAAVWPWQQLYEGDPTWPFSVGIGQTVTALFVGLLAVAAYTGFERFALRLSGARRMSRREELWLGPMLRRAADDLDIATPPPLLMTEELQPRAYATIRHIVISRGLVDELERDRAAIIGILAHELAHWRRGDATAQAWTKGVAAPLYVLHEIAHRLIRGARWRPVQWLLRSVLWSVLVTVKFIVRPALAKGLRDSEFHADDAAAQAGHGEGLRRALARLGVWETALDGWDEVMASTHPHIELRMERLESEGRYYPPYNEFSLVAPGADRGEATSHLGEP